MARRWAAKKRSLHVVCEHFELFSNAARGTQIYFELGFIFRLKPIVQYTTVYIVKHKPQSVGNSLPI
jgi:hypothetical protein